MYYISYGSNMNRTQMAQRCPGAKLVSTGYIPKVRLEFRGYPGNAHATLVPDRKFGCKVPVAVWQLDDKHEKALDCYEGYPTYYRKETWGATLSNGRAVNGLIYLMNGEHINMPSKRYYDGIESAYIDLNLEEQIPILEQALAASKLWEPTAE